MPRYVALLRGINVGGHRVRMGELRDHLSALGLEEVSTLLASGNVIFEAGETSPSVLEEAISQQLEGRLGYAVPTFVRTPAEIKEVALRAGGIEAASVYVIFLTARPDDALLDRLRALAHPDEEFWSEGREIYWALPGRLSDSPLFGSAMDRVLGGLDVTMRNATTVRKMADRVSEHRL